jgi:thymidylate synthase (FAD)
MMPPSDEPEAKWQRPVEPAIEELIGRRYDVLDDGFVRVVDYLGNDAAIVQAARVSYGAGTKRLQDDRGLLRYLMRHQHTTPFEMCELKLHVRAPMDTWRQWIRHRTASVNEYSTRYSVAIDSAQVTTATQWRLQAGSNRQGSAGYLDANLGAELTSRERRLHRIARRAYERRLQLGVAREQARKDLPLSTYTEAYWKIDLHNLLHFLHLRMDDHAQAEIRSYATVIGHEIVGRWVPLTWEAFSDYRVNAITLSAPEIELLKLIISHDDKTAFAAAVKHGWFVWDPEANRWKANRERNDFIRKISRYLGIHLDWTERPGPAA